MLYVPGVTVSGLVRSTGPGTTLSIGGRAAAHGTLQVDATGRLSGRLGGRDVAGPFRAAAGLTARAAVARGPRLP